MIWLDVFSYPQRPCYLLTKRLDNEKQNGDERTINRILALNAVTYIHSSSLFDIKYQMGY